MSTNTPPSPPSLSTPDGSYTLRRILRPPLWPKKYSNTNHNNNNNNNTSRIVRLPPSLPLVASLSSPTADIIAMASSSLSPSSSSSVVYLHVLPAAPFSSPVPVRRYRIHFPSAADNQNRLSDIHLQQQRQQQIYLANNNTRQYVNIPPRLIIAAPHAIAAVPISLPIVPQSSSSSSFIDVHLVPSSTPDNDPITAITAIPGSSSLITGHSSGALYIHHHRINYTLNNNNNNNNNNNVNDIPLDSLSITSSSSSSLPVSHLTHLDIHKNNISSSSLSSSPWRRQVGGWRHTVNTMAWSPCNTTTTSTSSSSWEYETRRRRRLAVGDGDGMVRIVDVDIDINGNVNVNVTEMDDVNTNDDSHVYGGDANKRRDDMDNIDNSNHNVNDNHDNNPSNMNSSGVCLAAVYECLYGGVTSLSWSRDGRCVACGGEDDMVTVWDAHHHGIIGRGVEHRSFVGGVCFDGNIDNNNNNNNNNNNEHEDILHPQKEYRILSVGEDCRMCLWEVAPSLPWSLSCTCSYSKYYPSSSSLSSSSSSSSFACNTTNNNGSATSTSSSSITSFKNNNNHNNNHNNNNNNKNNNHNSHHHHHHHHHPSSSSTPVLLPAPPYADVPLIDAISAHRVHDGVPVHTVFGAQECLVTIDRTGEMRIWERPYRVPLST